MINTRSDDGETALREEQSVASGRSMDRIAEGAGRKPKAFMLRESGEADAVWHSKPATNAARVVHAARPAKQRSAMPNFIAPQLCTLQERAPDATGWAHELKLDGYRMQMRVAAGKAETRTRTGLDWTHKFAAIAKAGAKLPDCIIDGEACALDADGGTDFSALQDALSDGDAAGLIFFAFDLLWLGSEDLRGKPLSLRKQKLEALLQRAKAPLRYVPHFEVSGEEMRETACKMNLEGVVSKKLDAPYRSGRTQAWVKSKCRAGQEVVIGGWTENEGRFRSLLAGVWRDGELRYAGRVGTGYNQNNVGPLAARLKRLANKTSPFSGPNAPKPTQGIFFTKPELVAEIEFAGWTGDNMVRQAAFKGLREDKPATSVVREPPMSTKTAAPKRQPAKSATVKVATRDPSIFGVAISHPDKILWPATDETPSFSKRDLATYFAEIGDWMLPHLKGRPCSMVRAPDGITKELFFQRHAMRGASPLINAVKVAGDKQPYLQFDSVEALVEAPKSQRSNYIHGIASHGGLNSRGVWCSISTPRRM